MTEVLDFMDDFCSFKNEPRRRLSLLKFNERFKIIDYGFSMASIDDRNFFKRIERSGLFDMNNGLDKINHSCGIFNRAKHKKGSMAAKEVLAPIIIDHPQYAVTEDNDLLSIFTPYFLPGVSLYAYKASEIKNMWVDSLIEIWLKQGFNQNKFKHILNLLEIEVLPLNESIYSITNSYTVIIRRKKC